MSAILDSGNLISFPKDGTKFYGAQAGVYSIDFDSGQVIDPSGSPHPMSQSLSDIQKNYVKSVYVWVSDIRAQISIGSNKLPSLKTPSMVIQGIRFEQMQIIFPSGMIPPNDFGFQIIASDQDIFPLGFNLQDDTHIPTPLTGNAPATYGVSKNIFAAGFKNIVFITFNTDPTNAINVEVQASEDGVSWATEQGYPVTIPAGDYNVFSGTVNHAYYRVLLETNVVGQTPAFEVQTSES
ncbi:MAG: hypothetical protein KGI08_05445 [Thaumarchaeota archaeon]|nr:hypothetical protein [Nitrososphaerota archaeon]